MEAIEFTKFRKKLKKTQQQIANLLGKSIKAVQSYEQGWRSIPPDAERQILFLASKVCGKKSLDKQCWTIMKCPAERKKQCPAWEFKAGKLCWFINGTICHGTARKNWKEKSRICRACDVMAPLFQ
jgi:DNA-binding XRE family transcriptional regulator